ncbi:hypothetical protein Tco_0413112 [Tanacetum coccineum]
MASQDARLTKFEADFKQQQSEMTNKIDTVLKAITDRIARALPSDTVKNPKLSTSLVFSARSYPEQTDNYPQCSISPPSQFKLTLSRHIPREANSFSQTSLLRPWMEIETQQLEEPEPTLEDEFQDLHLNLPEFPHICFLNANPLLTNNHPILPAALRAQAIQELHEIQRISAFVDSRLKSIERFLNNFANQPNETNINDLEFDDESVDTPLDSPYLHSDNDSDDGEVLNELIEYENVGMLHQEKAINSFDRDDLPF